MKKSLTILTLAVSLAGCGQSSSSSGSNQPIPTQVERVRISDSSIMPMQGGTGSTFYLAVTNDTKSPLTLNGTSVSLTPNTSKAPKVKSAKTLKSEQSIVNDGGCQAGINPGKSCYVAVTPASQNGSLIYSMQFKDTKSKIYSIRQMIRYGVQEASHGFYYDGNTVHVSAATNSLYTVAVPFVPAQDFDSVAVTSSVAPLSTEVKCAVRNYRKGNPCTAILTYAAKENVAIIKITGTDNIGRVLTATKSLNTTTNNIPNVLNNAINTIVTAVDTTTITLFNNGLSPATELNLPNSDSNFIVSGSSCSSTLATGDSCTFNLGLNPSVTQNGSATITYTYNNGSNTTSVPMTIYFIAPTPMPGLTTSISPSDVTYTVVGESIGSVLTITNNSSTNTTLSNIAVSPNSSLPAGFTYANNTENNCITDNNPTGISSLAQGASCTINLIYAPAAAFANPDIASTMTILAKADYTESTGLSHFLTSSTSATYSAIASNANLSLPALNSLVLLANGESSVSESVGVTNTGGYAASNVSYSLLSAPSGMTLSNGDCGNTLASGASCTLNITYKTNIAASGSAILAASFDGSSKVTGLTATTIEPYVASATALIKGEFKNVIDSNSNLVPTTLSGNYSFVPTSSYYVDVEFTYTNSGSESATKFVVSSSSLPAGASVDTANTTCGYGVTSSVLDVNGSCVYAIKYVDSTYLALYGLNFAMSNNFVISGYSYTDSQGNTIAADGNVTVAPVTANVWETSSLATPVVESSTRTLTFSFTASALDASVAPGTITYTLNDSTGFFSGSHTCTILSSAVPGSCNMTLNYSAGTPAATYPLTWTAAYNSGGYYTISNQTSVTIPQ